MKFKCTSTFLLCYFKMCNDNEYQCSNGQCIPRVFFHDQISECSDQSDEIIPEQRTQWREKIFREEPTFTTEDTSCVKSHNMQWDYTYLTSSCVQERAIILRKGISSIKSSSIPDECWTAMKCIIHAPSYQKPLCLTLSSDGICDKIISNSCPDIIYVPAFPLLFAHIYFAQNKSQLIYSSFMPPEPTYVCYNDKFSYIANDNKPFLLTNNNTCRL
jgi:hypothetical protein